MEILAKDVKDRPDLYQYECAKKFGFSQSAISYALKRLKISTKKRYAILKQMSYLSYYFNSRYFVMSL